MLTPRIGDLTPAPTQPPAGLPSWATNLLIIGTGIGMGLAAFPYREKAMGRVVLDAGGGIAGIGFIFMILDFAGFRPKL